MTRWRQWGLTVGLLVATSGWTVAAGRQLFLSYGYASREYAQNAGGGFDYLPNGDVIAMTIDYFNAPGIYLFDANGDGNPAVPQQLAILSPNDYGSFIKVSPLGDYALFGVTGAENLIDKLNLSTYARTHVVDLTGNFGLVFLSQTTAVVSANPNSSQTNSLYYLDVNNPASLRAIVQIQETPSGPVTTNPGGDLYYVKSTYEGFPPPPGSSHLLKFTAAQIQDAITYGTVLGEGDSQLNIALDGGSGVAVNAANQIYVSAFSGSIYSVSEITKEATLFCSIKNNPNGGFTFLGFYLPTQPFNPCKKSTSKLGAAFGDFYALNFTFLEFTPLTRCGPPKYIQEY